MIDHGCLRHFLSIVIVLLHVTGCLGYGSSCPGGGCPQAGGDPEETECCEINNVPQCCTQKFVATLVGGILGGVFGLLLLIGAIVGCVVCCLLKSGKYVCLKSSYHPGHRRYTMVSRERAEQFQRQQQQQLQQQPAMQEVGPNQYSADYGNTKGIAQF